MAWTTGLGICGAMLLGRLARIDAASGTYAIDIHSELQILSASA
jgi:hypothetical protein